MGEKRGIVDTMTDAVVGETCCSPNDSRENKGKAGTVPVKEIWVHLLLRGVKLFNSVSDAKRKQMK